MAGALSPLCKSVQTCRNTFIENDCDGFAETAEQKKKLIDCSEESIGKEKQKSFEEVLDSCSGSVKKSVLDTISKLADLPNHLTDNFDKMISVGLAAQKICEAKLGYSHMQAWQDQFVDRNKGLLYEHNRCTDRERDRLYDFKLPDIPNMKQMLRAVRQLKRANQCFRGDVQAQVICPIAASLIGGGAAGVLAKFALKRAVLITTASKVAKEGSRVDAYAAEIATLAKKEKEILSGDHVQDLIDFSKTKQGLALAEKLGLDVEHLRMGLLDSDLGKNLKGWQVKVLDKSDESEELLNVLTGRSKSIAGDAMREILDEAGMGGKTFLSKNLSNDQLREIIKKNGAMQGFLHEVPGMGSAIDDFLTKKIITKEQFKIRMKTNLFHNGPHTGFWGDQFADKIVPNSMGNADDLTKTFFKDTLFDRGPNKDGIHAPLYPGSLSSEGVYHTLIDRLSQGTRGGMIKIFAEVAGDAYETNRKVPLGQILMFGKPPNGLNSLTDLVMKSPFETERQMAMLQKHTEALKKAGHLNVSQQKALEKMIEDGRERLNVQNRFISETVTRYPSEGPVTRLTLEYSDVDGKYVRKVITPNTPADEAVHEINQLMLAEEKLSGDPMRSLGSGAKGISQGKVLASMAVGGTASALSVPPDSCRGKIFDKQTEPSVRPGSLFNDNISK